MTTTYRITVTVDKGDEYISVLSDVVGRANDLFRDFDRAGKVEIQVEKQGFLDEKVHWVQVATFNRGASS